MTDNPKDIIGSTKPPLSSLPCGPLFEHGAVHLLGALKYGRHNWRKIGVRASIYYDAAMRHLTAWWEGESVDKESGISHLMHVCACLYIVRDAEMHGMLRDDRPPPTPQGWMPREQVERMLRQAGESVEATALRILLADQGGHVDVD